MLIASVAELVSIGMVVPFLSVLIDPSIIFESEVSRIFLHIFKITDESEILLPITVAFSSAALVAGMIRVSLTIAQTRIGYLTGAELGVQIFNKTLHQSYETHLGNNTSDVIAAIGHKTTALVQQGIIAVLTMISYSLLLIAIICVLMFINLKVSIVSFAVFGGIYGGMIFVTKPILEEKGKLVTRMQGSVVKNIQEGLGAIRDILLDGSQSVFTGAFKRSEFKLRQAQISHIILSTTPKFIVEALGIALIAILAYVLIQDEASSGEIFPTLGALALGAQRLLPNLQQLYATWSSYRAGQAAFSDALDLLDQPIKKINQGAKPLKFRDGVRLVNVSFHYQFRNTLILDSVNLDLPKGARVGIIGVTGSGKSTVLDIIMGLLKPTSGDLLVDNIVIDQTNSHLWQAMVSHVPQTIFLSDATIAENIAFGESNDEIDYQRLEIAMEKAQLSAAIKDFPHGNQTLVGERGARLSGGQRQRIGIARAIYKGSDFIVFDEATSALDSFTESEVMKSISDLPKEITMIIVTHRTSTLAECDYIYQIKDARLTQVEAVTK